MKNNEKKGHGAPTNLKGSQSLEVDLSDEVREELVRQLYSIVGNIHASKVKGYFDMGCCLKAHNEAKYGKETVKWLSQRIDISVDTIYKSCQFAKKWNGNQVEELLTGTFQVSWNSIRSNLAVDPVEFIRIFKDSGSLKEFNEKIIVNKQPSNPKEEPDKGFCGTPTISNENPENVSPPEEDPEADTTPDEDLETVSPPEEDPEDATPPSKDSEAVNPPDEDPEVDTPPVENPASTDPPGQMTYLGSLKQDVKSDLSGTTDEDLANKVQHYEFKIKTLETRIQVLERENAELQEKNKQLALENEMLEGQLDELQAAHVDEEQEAYTELDFEEANF